MKSDFCWFDNMSFIETVTAYSKIIIMDSYFIVRYFIFYSEYISVSFQDELNHREYGFTQNTFLLQ